MFQLLFFVEDDLLNLEEIDLVFSTCKIIYRLESFQSLSILFTFEFINVVDVKTIFVLIITHKNVTPGKSLSILMSLHLMLLSIFRHVPFIATESRCSS